MNRTAPYRRSLSTFAWTLQGLLTVVFAGGGLYKLVTPYAEAVEQFGDIPHGLLITASIFEMVGGLGVLLPSLTRVLPAVTVLAALGCALLQGAAVVFHVLEGDSGELALNVALIAVALGVAWIRWRVVPIRPRTVTALDGS
ncbi:DoxX family protein [Aeromicrobium endophyticum]|uniref:DoxX family protein n=1 Tax=Aeromicrobium endophyticum TaxID=2292704 RepID=A0A371P3N8_9ACTN|nr:DoxX family protein [Aeromicrobium endophyticum]REK70542.1 DoxX family protein [Aeromicrobium endophyticum]